MKTSRTFLVLTLVLAAAAAALLSGARSAYSASPAFVDIGAALTAVQNGSVAWGDFNTDGKLDVLLTGSATSTRFVTKIYQNNGNGSFSENAAAETGLVGVRSSSVAWGDYNNDGNPDILLTGLSSSGRVAKIYKNNGNGTFTEDTTAESVLTAVNAGSVAWGDYNRDGKQDILLTGLSNSGMVAKIYRNFGNGIFSENTVGSSALARLRNTSAAWGDYNLDGKPDILLTGYIGAGYISKIYTNNGAGTFSDDTTAGGVLAKVGSGSVAWGDYNSDGYPDILLTGNTGSANVSKVYRNNHNGTFSVTKAALTGVHNSSVAWGDYNSDGKPDILLTGSTASGRVSRIYRNNGNDTFTAVTTGLNAVYNSSVAWGDYNSDGKLDVLLNGYTTARLSRVYRNQTAKWNTEPNAPGNLYYSPGPTHITLAWDKAADSQTPVAALTYNIRVGTTSGGSEIISPLSRSNGVRLVPQDGNVGERTTYSIVGLPVGTYYWSVQAVDTSFAGSAFAGEKTFTVTPRAPSGRIVSARLSKTQFFISQVGKIKLVCKFSPKSKVFAYSLKLKTGNHLVLVRKAKKTGPFTLYKTTVKKLFAGKTIKRGLYILTLSGDKNAKTLRFRIA